MPTIGYGAKCEPLHAEEVKMPEEEKNDLNESVKVGSYKLPDA